MNCPNTSPHESHEWSSAFRNTGDQFGTGLCPGIPASTHTAPSADAELIANMVAVLRQRGGFISALPLGSFKASEIADALEARLSAERQTWCELCSKHHACNGDDADECGSSPENDDPAPESPAQESVTPVRPLESEVERVARESFIQEKLTHGFDRARAEHLLEITTNNREWKDRWLERLHDTRVVLTAIAAMPASASLSPASHESCALTDEENAALLAAIGTLGGYGKFYEREIVRKLRARLRVSDTAETKGK